MDLRYLDIFHTYCHTKDGFKFLYKLQNYKDIKVFSLKSVQIIID